jgi:predicted ribosomally synthesized peptide with nif11-like leader
MSNELDAFLNHVQKRPDLQEQLGSADLMGVLELAAGLGYRFRAADLLKAQARQILEMDDDSLDRLAAGGLDDLMNISEFQAYMNRI